MSDLEIGTWNADIPASHYAPGRQPTVDTLTIARSVPGPGLTHTSHRVVNGVSIDLTTQRASPDDGRDRPVVRSNTLQVYDTCAYRQTNVSPLTITFSRKSAGRVVATGTIVMSNGNNTRTVTVTHDGITHTVIYYRQ
jgi:hypothetical protein